MRTRILSSVLALGALFAAGSLLPRAVYAGPPQSETYFICPTVGLHNPNGQWVIGAHGAYYVNTPIRQNGSRVYVTVPEQVFSHAQIPAGWGLYNDLPTYPNYETNDVEAPAVALSEGVSAWLGDNPGFQEGDVVSVANNHDGTYTVTVVDSMMNPSDIGNTVTINASIPLASGAIW